MGFTCQCQVHRLSFGKELFTYELFYKPWSPNLHFATATSIWGMALNTFWERALYIYNGLGRFFFFFPLFFFFLNTEWCSSFAKVLLHCFIYLSEVHLSCLCPDGQPMSIWRCVWVVLWIDYPLHMYYTLYMHCVVNFTFGMRYICSKYYVLHLGHALCMHYVLWCMCFGHTLCVHCPCIKPLSHWTDITGKARQKHILVDCCSGMKWNKAFAARQRTWNVWAEC